MGAMGRRSGPVAPGPACSGRIPPEIEAAAERSPWGHPADRFAMRADTAIAGAGGCVLRPGGRGAGRAGLGARRRRRRRGRRAAAPAVRHVAHRRRPVRADARDARRARGGRRHPTRMVVGRWPEAADGGRRPRRRRVPPRRLRRRRTSRRSSRP